MEKIFNYFFKKSHYQDTLFNGYLLVYATITLITFVVDVWTKNYFNQLLQLMILIFLFIIYRFFREERYRTWVSIFLAWFSSTLVFLLVLKNDFSHDLYYVLFFMSFHFFILLYGRVLLINLLLYTIALSLLMFWGYEHSTNRLFFDDPMAILIFIELGGFLIFTGIFIHYFLYFTLKKLEISNAQKEILLQEVHHRVKNNLNMMSSILGLQTNSKDKNVQALVKSNRQRLEAIAMVHELLYKHDDYVRIDFGLYVHKLAEYLLYACTTLPIKLNIQTHEIKLSLETMTHLGLVLQELLSNSLKYAFKERGSINIELVQEDKKYILHYADSGDSSSQKSEGEGLGLELIDLKVRQLGGTVRIDKERGFTYTIEFYDLET